MSISGELARLIELAVRWKNVVFCDIDKTIRWDKGYVDEDTEAAILGFHKQRGFFIPITGGHIRDIPAFLLKAMPVFAESSAVLHWPDGSMHILASEDKQAALRRLKDLLRLRQTKGIAYLYNRKTMGVILEGPRFASLTLATGMHPDYPACRVPTLIEDVDQEIREHINRENLPLSISEGTAEQYQWRDIRTQEKEDAVGSLVEALQLREVKSWYIGDGANDYRAMQLPRVTPVGLQNSIEAIWVLAREKGIAVDLPGPDGGVVEALRLIQERGGKAS